ncbi:hypothetical protein PINS_up011675 [Pythium insidiosum]|nr:hypothetical protein PINS_up011675 [Pythium insidiosum]
MKATTCQFLPLLTVFCVALAVAAAANIDKELNLDGSTTYCHGVQKAQDPLAMDAVSASSAGRCPVSVKLSPSSLVAKVREPLTIDWRTTINVAAMTSGLFPHVIDAKSKLPRDVVTSVLRACKAGSNCVDASNVVVPAVTGPADAERGAFDDQGRKALRAHRFTFDSGGEYVVVGEVLLPGDPALNISATAFLAFQRVTVTTDGGAASMVMATVRPSSSGGSSEGILASDADGRTNLRFQSPSSGATGSPSSGGIDAEFRGKPQPKNASASYSLLTIVGAVGILFVIVVVVILVVRRQRRKAADDAAAAAARTLAPRKPPQGPQAEIYRLDFSLDDVRGPKSQLRHHHHSKNNKATLAPVTQFPRFSLEAVPANTSFPSQRSIAKNEGGWETTIAVLDDDLHSLRRSSVSTSQFNDSQYGGLKRLTSVEDLHDSSPSSGRTSAASSFISESRDSSRLFLSEISVAQSVVVAPTKPAASVMTVVAPSASYLRDTSEFHVRFSDRESEDNDDIDVDDDDDDYSSTSSSIYDDVDGRSSSSLSSIYSY